MRPRRHSLRARIVLTIIGSVIATSLIFGLAAFGIAYTTEDRLFRSVLAEEVTRQKSSWQRSGELAAPERAGVTIHPAGAMLPSDIGAEFAENPNQTEFYGLAGRHYHIQRFDLNDGRAGVRSAPAVAVFEVSRDLLVRPVRDSLIVLLAGTGFFVAVVMAVFGWWLANRAMKPLSALARDVAATDSAVPALDAGNYPANEIGTLAEALEQAFARTRGLVERERTFTRDASHELRTPLAVVRGAVEVMRLNRRHPPHFAEPLRRIETATADMALALDQLLALARENEGVIKERVALRPMIDKAVAWAELRYPGAAITVSVNVDADAAVVVHPTSLQLVLNNLIGNCFQHVGTGRLTIDLEGGHLSISDDGPGFQADTDPFEPFTKGDASIGSGLGLDISRRLCEAARIGLTVDGNKIGRGAHFQLEFKKT
jgi:signal transduction histidine kinase